LSLHSTRISRRSAFKEGATIVARAKSPRGERSLHPEKLLRAGRVLNGRQEQRSTGS
jgi:hypothetical protein